ncbi:Fe(2+) transporter FeoB [anaerobic digester metagenome]
MKILLMGNPNVGKSVVFSRLTGVHVVSSNYPGTTVGYTKGKINVGTEEADMMDVPGTYSLTPSCKAEEVARDMFFDEKPDLVVNVLDSTNLERNLFLTLQILESGIPTVIVLNMWDAAKRKGVHINLEKLTKSLGVPVIPATAVTGEGINETVSKINEVSKGMDSYKPKITSMNGDERWAFIGNILDDVQRIEHRHPTILERLEDASVHPVFGFVIAAVVLYITLEVVVGLSNMMITYIMDPFYYNYYGPFVTNLISGWFPNSIVQSILVGTGYQDATSFGILTTGVYVEFAVVLPYILFFYFMLGVLEDFGYLPRLAVLIDSLMHKIGLHGYSVIPIILGFGCNFPAVMSTRILEGKREKFIAATLIAISVPCMAQTAVIIGLLGPYGLQYIAIVYGTLFLIFIFVGMLLNRLIKGESPEVFLEIPPYRIPHLNTLLKKTWFRVKAFVIEAVPFVFLGVLAINLLYIFGIMNVIIAALSPVLSNLFGLPNDAIGALVMGLLRKDLATAMLAPLNLGINQLVVASTVLAVSFPCIATLVILLKEIGIKDTLKTLALMMGMALVVGTILHLILG